MALRKAGTTEYTLMAILRLKSPDEAKKYVKKANRRILADCSMRKLEIPSSYPSPQIGQKPSQLHELQGLFVESGTPYGTRTRVTAVKGRRPNR
jgi:hypothetical protein